MTSAKRYIRPKDLTLGRSRNPLGQQGIQLFRREYLEGLVAGYALLAKK